MPFNRSWTEYRDGFGTEGQDCWIGLEALHRITKSGPYELVVEMTNYWYRTVYARYDRFEIGSEFNLYLIVNLGRHSGTVADGLREHRCVIFSTYDRDTRGCAAQHGGDGGTSKKVVVRSRKLHVRVG